MVYSGTGIHIHGLIRQLGAVAKGHSRQHGQVLSVDAKPPVCVYGIIAQGMYALHKIRMFRLGEHTPASTAHKSGSGNALTTQITGVVEVY